MFLAPGTCLGGVYIPMGKKDINQVRTQLIIALEVVLDAVK